MIYEKEPQTVLQSGAAASVHSIIHSIGVSFIEKTLNRFACGRVWVFVLGYIFVCLYKQAYVCVCLCVCVHSSVGVCLYSCSKELWGSSNRGWDQQNDFMSVKNRGIDSDQSDEEWWRKGDGWRGGGGEA